MTYWGWVEGGGAHSALEWTFLPADIKYMSIRKILLKYFYCVFGGI